MRQRLRERIQESSWSRLISNILLELERLRASINKITVTEDDGGGSSSGVVRVYTLPAIPGSGYQMVFWTSDSGGTGDNQTWWSNQGLTRWYPSLPTTKTGAPGS